MPDEWRCEVHLRSAKHACFLLLGAISAMRLGSVILVGNPGAESVDNADVGRVLVELDSSLDGRRTEEEVERVRATIEGVTTGKRRVSRSFRVGWFGSYRS